MYNNKHLAPAAQNETADLEQSSTPLPTPPTPSFFPSYHPTVIFLPWKKNFHVWKTYFPIVENKIPCCGKKNCHGRGIFYLNLLEFDVVKHLIDFYVCSSLKEIKPNRKLHFNLNFLKTNLFIRILSNFL